MWLVYGIAGREWAALGQPAAPLRDLTTATAHFTTPKAVPKKSSAEQTLVFDPPITQNRVLAVIKPSADGLSIVGCRINSDGQLLVTLLNETDADIMPTAEVCSTYVYTG